jgi:hypothetical protein
MNTLGRDRSCPENQWNNVDPSKWLIYALSRLGLAEGLQMRFEQLRRHKATKPNASRYWGHCWESVAAANPRLQPKRL